MGQTVEKTYRFADYTLDVGAHRLTRGDEDVRLQPKTFEMLLYLVERHGHLVEKRELLDALWADAIVTESALTQCIWEVRKALEDDASYPSYIQNIPRVGYKFIAEVEEIIAVAEEEETVEEEYTAMRVRVGEEGQERAVEWQKGGEGERMALPAVTFPALPFTRSLTLSPRWKLSRKVLAAALLLGVLMAAGLYFLPGRGEAIDSIAVLPFVNLSYDLEQEYFADGMTDSLIAELGKIGALKVISRQSIMQYRASAKPLLEIGQELNVSAVVEGSVLLSGDRVRITAKVIEVARDQLLWAQSYERDLRDILRLQREIARAIAGEIRVTLTPEEQRRLAGARPVDPDAYQLYLKGRYFWNKFTAEDFWKSIEYFQQAIEKDPGYALAHAGLADSYHVLAALSALPPKEAYSRVKAAVAKALEIDDNLAEAHGALGWCRLEYDWDWPAAEKEFQLAIEINPNAAQPHGGYALTLAAMGRFDEALAEIKRALEIDPVSLIINVDLGMVLYYARQYDLAIEQFRQTIEMDPDFPLAHHWLGRAYEKKAMYEEALTEYGTFRTLAHRDRQTTEPTLEELTASGWKGYWQKQLDLLLEARSNGRYIQPFWIADRYLHLDQREQAIRWLQKAYDERYGQLAYLNVDPLFDSLRSDPRFQHLLRQIGSPP